MLGGVGRSRLGVLSGPVDAVDRWAPPLSHQNQPGPRTGTSFVSVDVFTLSLHRGLWCGSAMCVFTLQGPRSTEGLNAN